MRTFASFTVLIYTFSIFLPFARPVYAQAPAGQSPLGGAHKSRLTIPVNKLSTLVIEKGDKEVNKRLLVSDYLSSTKAIVNGSGSVENYPSYYPYGLPKSALDQNLTDKYYTQQKKVTADSSVYNYNARYYNPMTGIFIQPDNVMGPNRYWYANNDPATLNDPKGQCPMCIGAAIGGGLDLATQMLVEGKKFEEVNWGSVAISAAGGAVGAGIGTSIAKMAATTGAKVYLTLTADWAVGTVTSIIENEVSGNTNLSQNIQEAAAANFWGVAFGAAGGKVASKVGGTIARPVVNQIEDYMSSQGPLTSYFYRKNLSLAGGANLILDSTSLPDAGGWANGRKIAINPARRHTTTFPHEVAHHQWHFSTSRLSKGSPFYQLQYDVNEIEAQMFAHAQLSDAMKANWQNLPPDWQRYYRGQFDYSKSYIEGYRDTAQAEYENLIAKGYSNQEIWNAVSSRQRGATLLKAIRDQKGEIPRGRK